MKILALSIVAALIAVPATAQTNRIDRIRPDAPELAAYGPHAIGVRTLHLVHKDQIDVVNVTAEAIPHYDRPITVEVWYPTAEDGAPTPYEGVLLRDGETAVTLHGRAQRDAAPATGTAWPVVIISHGYPGNRFLLSHLAENLASKGYVVASIDHPDSVYQHKVAFGSTLLNRPLDTRFVLDELARLGGDPSSFLNGIVDASRAVLIGYSMGAYGAVISAGGGVTQTAVDLSWGTPRGLLAAHLAGSESHEALMDPRFRAFISIAPWGRQYGLWDAAGLAGIDRPILYVGGSVDDIADYQNGIRVIYAETVNAPAWLLTFENANHNAAAPIPAPEESWKPVESLDFVPFEHYADAVWDTNRMNNILQHFATAFIDWQLKGDEGRAAYLDLIENANDGVFALNEDGTPKPEHNYWKGFAPRTAKGLRLEYNGVK
ncbi:MAG: dienelactone hydrolase [Alphaproteobacteria bacterium]|nr:MAG: dienelactone hydrolase [Alphaproteobacteria bacterium]